MTDISRIRVIMMTKMRLRVRKRSQLPKKRPKRARVWMSIRTIMADIISLIRTARRFG